MYWACDWDGGDVEKRPLGRPQGRWEDNIEVDLGREVVRIGGEWN
jgi:hypothetical protein